jgi:hypothetical protein
MSEHAYVGGCSCGAIELRIDGRPAAMGFCHCVGCRKWSASPVNAFTLWQRFALSITEHPGWGLVDVHAGVLPGFPFDPQFHLNYGEHALRMEDGLPKMRDLPSEMGGSGRTMPE